MSTPRYTLKGSGWEVEVSLKGVCDVRQLEPGVPVPVDGPNLMTFTDWYLLRCLRCGDPILVPPGVAPVCKECRE